MQKLNVAGVTGFWLCFCAIIFGIITNGGLQTIMNFIHLPSFIVTIGGAMFAVMATADSFEDYIDGLKSIYYAYQKYPQTTEQVSEQIIEMSDVARKEGLLYLEEYADQIEDEFFSKSVRLIVDGSEPELVRDILESELMHKEERNERRIRFWKDLGSYGPAWGMVGTLLGLINMMKSMGSNVEAIGSGMSLALITTLYGSILANWVCIPIARKLEKSSEQERLVMEVIIEGMLSVQAGENSRIIKEKFKSILAEDMEEAA